MLEILRHFSFFYKSMAHPSVQGWASFIVTACRGQGEALNQFDKLCWETSVCFLEDFWWAGYGQENIKGGSRIISKLSAIIHNICLHFRYTNTGSLRCLGSILCFILIVTLDWDFTVAGMGTICLTGSAVHYMVNICALSYLDTSR